MTTTDNRPLPFDESAERALLGSVLIKPRIYADLASDVRPDDFFMPAHRVIWAAMAAVERRGLTIDPISVGDEIRSVGEIKRIEGGDGYFVDLAGFVPSAERASEYATLVSEKATSRRLFTLCEETKSRVLGGVRPAELIETITSEAARLVVHRAEEITTAADIVEDLLVEIETRSASDASLTGIRSGVDALDYVTSGFDPGDLVVIAGDPGGGKTALAMQVAILLALFDDGVALVCNMEMSKKQLVERILAYVAGVDSWALRTGKIPKQQWTAIYAASGRIREGGPLALADDVFTLPQIRTLARAWRMRNPTKRGVLVVDYLQRMRAERGGDGNRAAQIGEWTSALKDLARDLGVPVLLLSQLNRAPSKDKRPPTMRDLRESGDIEADADTVLLIHNANKTEDGPTDLILDKNRKGPCRIATAHWTARYYRFSNLPNEAPQQQPLPGAA